MWGQWNLTEEQATVKAVSNLSHCSKTNEQVERFAKEKKTSYQEPVHLNNLPVWTKYHWKSDCPNYLTPKSWEFKENTCQNYLPAPEL